MKLSVCIPVYNCEKYIERCMRSLYAQTLAEIEFVFVDDCSTDGSFAEMERIAAECDPEKARTKLIRLPANRGRVGARFAALEAASGDYVGFCDADDWVEPSCYAKLMAAAEREHADAAICQYVDVAADGKYSSPRKVAFECAEPTEFVAKSFYSPGFNSLCNKIFRTSLAKRWLADKMPDLCVGEDLLMTMRFLSRAKRLAFVNEPLYCYRKTDKSVSRELSHRTISDMISCIHRLSGEFSALPKPSLDVMRVHALWAACRCRDFANDEINDLVRTFDIDFDGVRGVPAVKQRLLPWCKMNVSSARTAVRIVEFIRRFVA